MVASIALALIAGAASATSPVGLWKTVDDATGEARSHVRITESGGVVTGRIERILAPGKADAKCLACSGARKDQPVSGMTIIEGVRRDRSGAQWDGGTILDPNNGKVYRVRLTPQDGGRKLEVRGFLGPFHRNQYWQRIE
ncbi:MAG: DUF2147 domain-containing protein [Gammaproteobacteria bacterium]|nr:DUF2147 domain-containing protein [Gammaproteobacteria bacterium]